MPTSPSDAGIYAVECSCGTWSVIGGAADVLAAIDQHYLDHVLRPTPAVISPA